MAARGAVPQLREVVSEDSLGKREDLRHMDRHAQFVDPVTAQDRSSRELGGGGGARVHHVMKDVAIVDVDTKQRAVGVAAEETIYSRAGSEQADSGTLEVGIRGDDSTTREIDTLAAQIAAEATLFSLHSIFPS